MKHSSLIRGFIAVTGVSLLLFTAGCISIPYAECIPTDEGTFCEIVITLEF